MKSFIRSKFWRQDFKALFFQKTASEIDTKLRKLDIKVSFEEITSETSLMD